MAIQAIDRSNIYLGMTRNYYFSMLFIVCFLSVLLPSVFIYIGRFGLEMAVMQTFGISAVVWAAVVIGVSFAADSQDDYFSPSDRALTLLGVLACLVPSGGIAVLCQVLVALFCILDRRGDFHLKRAGWIFLAASVPMYWSKKLMSMLGEYIVQFDAVLVSLITFTERKSNIVPMPGGAGSLLIAPGCSSLANVSSAILCWVLFTQMRGIAWRPMNIVWCGLACASVIAINVSRISLIGYFPDYYYLLHDGAGSVLASWLSTFAAVVVCHWGTLNGKAA